METARIILSMAAFAAPIAAETPFADSVPSPKVNSQSGRTLSAVILGKGPRGHAEGGVQSYRDLVCHPERGSISGACLSAGRPDCAGPRCSPNVDPCRLAIHRIDSLDSELSVSKVRSGN